MTGEFEPPIEEVLDDLIPDWREQAVQLAIEGMEDEEIVAEFQRQMAVKVDGMLDLMNDLKGGARDRAV